MANLQSPDRGQGSRTLKLHELVREVKVVGFPADQAYTVYFFVVGWGWYYLISVLDDFSRYILA